MLIVKGKFDVQLGLVAICLNRVIHKNHIKFGSLFCAYKKTSFSLGDKTQSMDNNNNIQIAAISLPPLTKHPQSWAELLTFKPKCTIT